MISLKKILMVVVLLSLASCSTIDKNQPIRVYSNNYRLTGYNSAFDVPLVFFTTNKQFYILLIEKETGEKK